MKETKQKKEGAWMSPKEIAQKMINFIEDDFYKTNVLEPTAGEGAIVFEILNKKLNIGMTAQEAINTTYANEFDEGRYNTLLNNINQWCIEHGCNIEINNIRLGDATKIDFDDWIGENFNVITNLPFGSWNNSNLPRRIINNLANHRCVYLTKWSTACHKKYVPHVKKFENVVFPGIAYDTLLWEYDPEYTEGDIWIYWPIPKFPVHKLKKEYTKAGQIGMKKLYRIIKLTNMTHVSFSKSNNSCGTFLDIYLTDDEYDKIKDIQYDEFIKRFNKRRSMYLPREVIMDQLYKKAQWLFEY